MFHLNALVVYIGPAGRGLKSVTRTPRMREHGGMAGPSPVLRVCLLAVAAAGHQLTRFPPAPMHLFCSATAAAPPGNHRPFSRHTASGHSGHKWGSST